MFSDESKMEPENCKIEWKIYNLNKHAEYIQQDQFLTSKQFYNPKYPSVKWELRLYPGYNLNEDKSDILIYLNDGGGTYISLVQVGLKESNDYLKAKFVIYTLDEYGDKVYCCS
uniref:MATH domain-containing protein n=1 Tax=Meloidogyne hapla TaxID=6305 RepID=A0A1I8BDR7_MELHA